MVKARLRPPRRKEREPRRDLKLTCMSNLLSAAGRRVCCARDRLAGSCWSAQAGCRPRTRRAGPRRGFDREADFDIFGREHATTAFEDEPPMHPKR